MRLDKMSALKGAPVAKPTRRSIAKITLSNPQDNATRIPPIILQQLCSTVAAAALIATTSLATYTPQALAENVRVEDVESDILRAGLNAANERNFDVAERFFKIYITQEDPESASGWSNLGNVHLEQGKVQEAETDFTKAISLAPEAAVPYMNRAISRESLGLQAEQRGDSKLAQSLYADAVVDCNMAIEHDPKEFAAYFDRGNIEMRLGEYDAALTSFNTAADLAPGLAGYRLRAATLAFQTGDVKAAKRQMQGVVRKNGRNYAEAHAALSALSWAENDRDTAEEEFYKATQIDDRFSTLNGTMELTRWPPKLYEAYTRVLSITQ